MPDTVRYAFYLMLVGAAVQAISIIVSFSQTGTIRKAMRDQQIKQHNALSPSAINAIVDVTIALIAVVGLVYVGLWLWMAFKNRAGRQWARITGTVFFGIQALLTVVGVATYAAGAGASSAYSAGQTAASLMVGGVLLLIGLVTVILLWNSRSAAYFAQPPYGGYGQPPMPYGGTPYPNPYNPGTTPGLPPQQPGTPGLPPQPPGPGRPPAPGQGPGGFSPPA